MPKLVMDFHQYFGVVLLFAVLSCTPEKHMSVQRLENGQYSISHKNLSFLINPALGARVVSAKVGDKELLLQERDSLLNWGATFWPSPQSRWNWPPPYAFQFDSYSAEILGEKLVLKSTKDPALGLSVTKAFSIDKVKNCFVAEYQITNHNDTVSSVSPWEIVCVPANGARVFFPLGNETADTKSNLAVENVDGLGWFEYNPDKLHPSQKLFNNAADGWLGHINRDNLLFIKTFDKVPEADLPPGQGNVEVYVSKPLAYIELENHGAFMALVPGASLTYKVQWYLAKLPDGMEVYPDNVEFLKFVRGVIK